MGQAADSVWLGVTVAEPPRIRTGFLPSQRPQPNRLGGRRGRTVDGMSLFSHDDIDAALEDVDGWTFDDNALAKTFEFDDFASAIAFMADLRPAIDELDHHPEWTNVYNRIDVRLSSHDAGGVTGRDFKLARLLDKHHG